jgi:putative DNA primase/helicase
MLAAALLYARHGWPIFPCSRNKRPLVKNGFKVATTDEAQIRAWWGRWPDASVGCPTGPQGNGLFVLDVDLPEGPSTLAALEAKYGALPVTLEQRTGGGGRQLFFAWPAGRDIRNSASRLGPGLDVRGTGGYSILPPSGHTSGGFYSWASPKGTVPAENPRWLLNLICSPAKPTPQPRPLRPAPARSGEAYGRAALEAECGKVAVAPEGQRNASLNAAAFALGQLVAGGQVDRAAAEEALAHAAAQAGLAGDEAAKTIRSGLDAGERQPRKLAPGKKAAPPAAQGLQVGQPFNFFSVFRGSFIPNSLLRYPGLTPTGKLMWARMGQFCGRNGYCWPSISRLSKELGLSTRQVHRVVAELEQKGFLLRTPPSPMDKGKHCTTRYELLWHAVFCGPSDAHVTWSHVAHVTPLMSSMSPEDIQGRIQEESTHKGGRAQHPGRRGFADG